MNIYTFLFLGGPVHPFSPPFYGYTTEGIYTVIESAEASDIIIESECVCVSVCVCVYNVCFCVCVVYVCVYVCVFVSTQKHSAITSPLSVWLGYGFLRTKKPSSLSELSPASQLVSRANVHCA